MKTEWVVLFLIFGFLAWVWLNGETPEQKAEKERLSRERSEQARREAVRRAKEKLERREREKKERQRLEQEARKLRKEFEADKVKAQEHFDRIASQGVPRSVARENRLFLQENPLPLGNAFYGEDISPLTFYGYRVGKTRGLPMSERHEIMRYVLRAKLESPLAMHFRNRWGRPLTQHRRSAIENHIRKLAAQRSNRRNYELAVAHWEEDADWVSQHMQEYIKRFQRFGVA